MCIIVPKTVILDVLPDEKTRLLRSSATSSQSGRQSVGIGTEKIIAIICLRLIVIETAFSAPEVVSSP
ncbi:MAG: hypothetical protein QGH33_07065 [Pirellulaceae bacterium]|jgi:hypothetical protein|nr:hypothetical protein [Pirellulaceae bacterium]HJN13614.1 hypothetical protein [Pirellulaceae bacterium]